MFKTGTFIVLIFLGSAYAGRKDIDKRSLLNAIQDFTQEVYLQLASSQQNENFVFSPLSLHSALAMVYLGARPDSTTYKELQSGLGALNNPDQLKDSYKDYIKFLIEQKSSVKYGNHIWLKENYTIKEEYKNTVENYMNAKISNIDFQSLDAASEVNEWVSGITNGKIDQLVDSFSENTLMFLANALYFKDSWLYPFEDLSVDGSKLRDNFLTSDGESLEVDMMQLSSNSMKHEVFDVPGLFRDGLFDVVKIPYKNERFVMKIMVPTQDAAHFGLLEDFTNLTFVRDLRQDSHFNLFRHVGEKEFTGEVTLKMPTFKLDSKLEANEIFQKMEISQIFIDAELDLVTADKPLGISNIVHKAAVEVTANGTEGAAATGVEIVFFSASVSEDKEVVVNKPFIFVLEDVESKFPILVGRVLNPTI